MSLTLSEQVSAEEFKRWMGNRVSTCVGTYDHDFEGTGDGSGGTLTLSLSFDGTEWGFDPIIVITAVSVRISSDPTNVGIVYEVTGNRRLADDLGFASGTVSNQGQFLNPEYVLPRIAIEPQKGQVTGVFLRALFDSNVNSAIYHFHVWGLVFDAEIMAASGDYREIVAALT